MNMAGHDADFAFRPRCNDPWTVRPDQTRGSVLQVIPGAHHVDNRNAFGDTDYEGEARVGSLDDGVGGKWRRNKNHGGVRSRLPDAALDGVEYGQIEVLRAALAGGDAAD